MPAAPLPPDELQRLTALRALGVLDTPPEERFDRLTRLVQLTLNVPIALVSLIDDDRQWLKSSQGVDIHETPRSMAFCAYAILSNNLLVVEDATQDPRFMDNPMVCMTPEVRAYLGAPIYSPDGYRLGTLCAIDTQPRPFPQTQRQILLELAACVTDELRNQELASLTTALEDSRNRYMSLVQNIPGITYRCLCDEHWTMLYISNQCDPLSGYSAEELIDNHDASYGNLIHEDDRQRLTLAVSEAVTQRQPWHLEYRIQHRDGSLKWVEERGQAVYDPDGQPVFLEGFILDITREYKTRESIRRQNSALSLINKINLARFAQYRDHLRYALTEACDHLGLEVGIISEINDPAYTVRVVHCPEELAIREGDSLPVADTYCQWLLEQGGQLALSHVATSPYGGSNSHQALGLESYIASELIIRGKRYGTLNFSSRQPRPEPFDQTDHMFMNLLAHWVSAQIEQQLTETRLNKLADQAPGVLFQFRQWPDGRINFPYASKGIADIYGYPPEQLQTDAQPVFERIHPEDKDKVQASITESAAALSVWTCEYRVVKANGEVRWVTGTSMPERLPDGSTVWHGAIYDTHEAKLAELNLRERESRLRGLFELSPIGIALNDFDSGRFLDGNPALLAATGYSTDELTQLDFWTLTPPEHHDRLAQARQALRSNHRYATYEQEYQRKDGSRFPARLQGMLTESSEGKAMIWSFIEDISEQRRVERLKSEFVSTVSHELRTPLTSIIGALGLLDGAMGSQLNEDTRKLVTVANRNSQQLSKLIDDLLDIEKLDAGKMTFDFREYNALEILREALENHEHYAANKQIALTLHTPLDNAPVRVDSKRLHQALANLLSNAIKFSPRNASVRVEAHTDQRGLLIRVADQGPGIPPAFQARVFQRFAQVDGSSTRQQGGAGLGLAITRSLIENMAGKIGYTSTPGAGATFWIWLPGIDRQAQDD